MKFFIQENQDSLLQCVMQDVGFNSDRPIAACILYKSLLQWRSFEAERTNVFDRIIQTIGTAIEVSKAAEMLPPLQFFYGITSCVRFMMDCRFVIHWMILLVVLLVANKAPSLL